MSTTTEIRLREIAEKIEEVYGICGRTPVADPSPEEAEAIIHRLTGIGQVVLSLPVRFKDRYEEGAWAEMEGWGAANALDPVALDLSELQQVVLIFASAEPVINRHAFSNSNVQSGTIASLDTWYEQISKDWFDRTRRTYILIYLTVALTILRGALVQVGYELTSSQILVYCSVLLPVFWIAFDIFWGRKIYRIYNSNAEHYSTHTEYYETASAVRKSNIIELRDLTNNLRRRMTYQAGLWSITVIASLIATLVKLN